MCTASWLPVGAGYVLCFNRDESRSRLPGRPPSYLKKNGLSVIAPTDGNHGGTWIGVNDAGLAVALANRYQVPRAPTPEGRISRGLLVMELLGKRSLAEVGQVLSGSRPESFEPFTVTALERDSPAHLWSWDGSTLLHGSQEEAGLLIASSAADQDAAVAARRETFAAARADGPLNAGALARLHASHRPARGPLSICMHREEASTVSFTIVTVETRRATLAHANGPPCVTPLAPPLALDLRV